MSWYECIEEPLRDLVKKLRNNGFNTTCSCAHLPNPYIQMEWTQDADVTNLFELLLSEGYTNFFIKGTWYYSNNDNKRLLAIEFHPLMPKVQIETIKGEKVIKK